jgi:iron-sulfur cluster assembly protein
MNFSLQISLEALSELLHRQALQSSGYLALRLSTAGCNGWMFSFEQVNEPLLSDTLYQHNGLTLGVDKEHLEFLNRLSIDLTKTSFQTKFTFMSPLETHRCGCGESVRLSPPVDSSAHNGTDSLMAY